MQGEEKNAQKKKNYAQKKDITIIYPLCWEKLKVGNKLKFIDGFFKA